jgi:hypothetical protein
MYKKIEQLVKENKLTFGCGHNINAKYYFEKQQKTFLKELKEELEWLKHRENPPIIRNAYCFNCGEYINYELKGEKLVPNVTECFTETQFTVEIDVPTGKLMFDDWFKHATPLLEYLDERNYDINNNKVRVGRMYDYAEQGMFHFFVGGSSPSIFTKDNTIYIGNDECDEEDEIIPLIPNSEEKGYVSTELRWVSACDYSVYEQMAIDKFGEVEGKKKAKEALEEADVVLDIEPGRYRLSYYTDVKESYELYGEIEKISQ